MSHVRGWSVTVIVLLFGLTTGACSDATDVERLEITATGTVAGVTYLDLNGDGARTTGDPTMEGVTIVLTGSSSATPTAEVMTDDEGRFLVEEVPVGRYRVELADQVLADSLIAVGTPTTVEVSLEDPAEVVLGASYPELTVGQIRAATPGRRVFTTGIALNARQSFSDGRVSLRGEGGYLAATDVLRSTPVVSVGDSVRFLGTTAREFGRPVLDDVTPYVLVQQAEIPVPVDVSTGEAATADDGALDAALVRVDAAIVSAVSTAPGTGDVHVQADDASGSVEVVLRAFLLFPTRPSVGDTVAVAGTLAPFDDGSGSVRWRLLARSPSELVIAPGS